jgi:AI-2 transport protein TqsA
MALQKYAYGLIIFIASIFMLYIGKTLFMPLTLAIIAWFIIKQLIFYINKLELKGRKIPVFLQNIFAFIVVIGAFVGFSGILFNSAEAIQGKIPEYQQNLNQLIHEIELPFQMDFKGLFERISEQFNISSILGLAVSSVSSIFSNAVLILLYLLFILIESSSFKEKLVKLYPNQNDKEDVDAILSSINTSMSSYISLKTVTSLLTGILSYIILSIVGVDFAIFWAYLIFLLNYIPTIGSLIATLFPVLIAFIQFGTWMQPSIVLVAVAGVQVFVGNILEPKLMGNSLNVSPLVVLLSLAFWGWIWGVVGMIISVPIAIMLIIVCTQFKDLRWIAILLSSNGDLPILKKETSEVQKTK